MDGVCWRAFSWRGPGSGLWQTQRPHVPAPVCRLSGAIMYMVALPIYVLYMKERAPSLQYNPNLTSLLFPISRLIYKTTKVNSEITIKNTESGGHGNEGHTKYFRAKADETDFDNTQLQSYHRKAFSLCLRPRQAAADCPFSDLVFSFWECHFLNGLKWIDLEVLRASFVGLAVHV